MPTIAEKAREYITPTSLPMQEAVALWKGKTPLSKADIDARAEVNHDTAFAVGGITDAAMLQRVYDEIGRAQSEGMEFRDFKKKLADVWETSGFTGTKAWRVENIFRTNMQSTYDAGRYQQMKRVARLRPYWQYQAVQDDRTRKTHSAMNGKVFRHDDPIWSTWYPPNGYMCRCKVRTLSDRQVKARGIEVKAGNTVIQLPDRGFTRLPYASILAAITPVETALGGKILKRDPDFVPTTEISAEHIFPLKHGDLLPLGKSDAFYLKEFFDEFGFDPDEGGFITLPHIGRKIRIGRELFIDKYTGQLKIAKRGREQYLKLLATTIKNPYEIWSDIDDLPNGSQRSLLKFIRMFQDESGKLGGFALFELDTARGWVGVTGYVPGTGGSKQKLIKDIDKLRCGEGLIYREGNKKPE